MLLFCARDDKGFAGNLKSLSKKERSEQLKMICYGYAMLWNGKIIGVFIGAILGGPLGALIGLALGYLFDAGHLDPVFKRLGISRAASQQANVQQIFFSSTFTLMGHLAKSDGRVSEDEIRAAKYIMARLSLNPEMKKEGIAFFNQGKQPNFDVNKALRQLKKSCWNRPSLLRTFIEIQLQIAYADGQKISPKKYEALKYICAQLGVHGISFHQFEQSYRAEQNYQEYKKRPQQGPRRHLQDAYRILKVANTATDTEIKKAYRRQMSKNHPDKLLAKGLPPEMIKLATQKTQQIKSAYETIKQSRGIQ